MISLTNILVSSQFCEAERKKNYQKVCNQVHGSGYTRGAGAMVSNVNKNAIKYVQKKTAKEESWKKGAAAIDRESYIGCVNATN